MPFAMPAICEHWLQKTRRLLTMWKRRYEGLWFLITGMYCWADEWYSHLRSIFSLVAAASYFRSMILISCTLNWKIGCLLHYFYLSVLTYSCYDAWRCKHAMISSSAPRTSAFTAKSLRCGECFDALWNGLILELLWAWLIDTMGYSL